MATLKDVAKAAGVSTFTASVVLSGRPLNGDVSAKVAQHVREVAKQLGYRPNFLGRALQGGKSRCVGVVLDAGFNAGLSRAANLLASDYYGHLIGGIEETLRFHGYTMSILGPSADTIGQGLGSALSAIAERRVDGLILPAGGTNPHTPSEAIALAERGELLIVGIERPAPTPLPVVDYDMRIGLAEAIGHLVELGHRNIAYFGPTQGEKRDRGDACLELCQAAGALGTAFHVNYLYGDDSTEQSYHGFSRALGEKAPDFTAVVCYNDNIAIGVCRALVDHGLRVPTDVSVIGFDNTVAHLTIPQLTTIDHMLFEEGKRAVEILLEMLQGPQGMSKYRGYRESIPTRLVIRKSTAPPPANPKGPP